MARDILSNDYKREMQAHCLALHSDLGNIASYAHNEALQRELVREAQAKVVDLFRYVETLARMTGAGVLIEGGR